MEKRRLKVGCTAVIEGLTRAISENVDVNVGTINSIVHKLSYNEVRSQRIFT